MMNHLDSMILNDNEQPVVKRWPISKTLVGDRHKLMIDPNTIMIIDQQFRWYMKLEDPNLTRLFLESK